MWPRLEKVFALYDARGHLASATGRGTLQGKAPQSSHCNNVGAFHRRDIYPQFERWFGIEPPEREYTMRRGAGDLTCLTPKLIAERKPRPVHRLAHELAEQNLEKLRSRLADLDPLARREQMQKTWAPLLGEIAPSGRPRVIRVREEKTEGVARVEHLRVETEPGIVVPVLMLLPENASADSPAPVVVAVCESGKADLLAARRADFAQLVEAGVAVCLPDLRGFGETSPGGSGGRG